jgi:hypothetical protein
MKLHRVSFVRRAMKDEHAQIMLLVAFGLVAFVGLAGISIDLIHG